MLKRNLYQKIINDLDSGKYIIVTGARQVGKTTLLKQIQEFLSSEKRPNFFINLEDPDYLRLLNEHPRNVFKLFSLPEDKISFLLVDEVQYLDNPTNFLKYLYDEFGDRLVLVVSGSSAFYLDTRFKDSLAGRKKIYRLNTLSLDEFLRFRGKEELSEYVRQIAFDQLNTENIPLSWQREVDHAVNEYAIYGGYPRVVLSQSEDEKTEVLYDLATSFIKKDILESGIRNDQTVLSILKVLAEQTGGLLNANSLAKMFQISNTAVNNYIYVLNKAFILCTTSPFARNIRNEIRKMPKTFFADLGLRNALLKDFRTLALRQDRGVIYENFIFRQLLDRVAADDIKFWRTQQGNEIDFIVMDSVAYEVKYSIGSRGLSKYRMFKMQYPEIKLHFICREVDANAGRDKDVMRF